MEPDWRVVGCVGLSGVWVDAILDVSVVVDRVRTAEGKESKR